MTSVDSMIGLLRTDRLTSGWPFRPRGAAATPVVPISPMPMTVGRSRNGGIRASTSRDSSRSSASFGFIAIHV